ncbi:MAG: hypothetical protein ACP5JB_02615 [candidate division WOR-3 bacterium]
MVRLRMGRTGLTTVTSMVQALIQDVMEKMVYGWAVMVLKLMVGLGVPGRVGIMAMRAVDRRLVLVV